MIQIPIEEISKILCCCYNEHYILVKEAEYSGRALKAHIKFSNYPFINGKMSFVSANLINLAVYQVVLIHIGMMIKNGTINLNVKKENGSSAPMSFEEYIRFIKTLVHYVPDWFNFVMFVI